MEVAVRDGGEAETSFRGIVQVSAHGGKVDERHVDWSQLQLQLVLPAPLCFSG